MEKKEIPQQELVSIINHELAKREACPGCRINEIRPLSAPDSEGCNWERPEIRCGGFVPGNICNRAVDQVVEWARNHFKLRLT